MDLLTVSHDEEMRPTDAATSSHSSSPRLLDLPAELRAEIFAHVLADVRCRRPIVIWDDVCMSISGQQKPISTALLLVSRSVNAESSPILYENTAVEISIRGDTLDQSFPRFQVCLGPIHSCGLLSRLRHIELEVSYTCRKEGIARSTQRVQAFAQVCQKLKTVDLTFCDEGRRSTGQMPTADAILTAAMGLECERFVSIARNRMAGSNMDPDKWQAFQKRVKGERRAERFREVSFDHFEHAFKQKN